MRFFFSGDSRANRKKGIYGLIDGAILLLLVWLGLPLAGSLIWNLCLIAALFSIGWGISSMLYSRAQSKREEAEWELLHEQKRKTNI
jgi:hypothetical protein